ncbi:hypothetical protein WJX72_001846 [[Myrmecia] bisecta]|uniref:CS domain-containing protein n=1 Tax=[Myrmecia] bisecta TaxID=41462 RepID=A0AAW1PZF8_9CHLO
MESVDSDIEEIQHLLCLTQRKTVQDWLMRLLVILQQVQQQRQDPGHHRHQQHAQALSNGRALPDARLLANGSGAALSMGMNAPLAHSNYTSLAGRTGHGDGLLGSGGLSPYDPVWPGPQANRSTGGLNTFQGASQGWAPPPPQPPAAKQPTGVASVKRGLPAAAAPSSAYGSQGDLQSPLQLSSGAEELSSEGACGNGSIHPALKYGISLPLQTEMQRTAAVAEQPADRQLRVLTVCSWEQTESMVKVYIPLRGVQTDLLRAVFEPLSVEVKVLNLQGRNYVFRIKPTYKLIDSDACSVAASKTKKNILITIQKLQSFTPDEKRWKDLYGGPRDRFSPTSDQ